MASNKTVTDTASRWLSTFNEIFYSSGTIAVTGNSGIIATPNVVSGGVALHPLFFVGVGTGLATDETCTVTIGWYGDAAGNGGALGTTSFAAMTAGAPIPPAEAWPGDVTFFNAGRDLVPLLPFRQINWTLAGTTISLSFILYISYLKTG